jgi:superkiller protein 8
MLAEYLTDVYSIAVTRNQVIAGSGSSNIKIHSSTDLDVAPVQELSAVDKLGVHHVSASLDGKTLATIGFSGTITLFARDDGINSEWAQLHQISGKCRALVRSNVAEQRTFSPWAVCLDGDGSRVAATSHNGKIRIWSREKDWKAVQNYDTKESFGMCIDMVAILYTYPANILVAGWKACSLWTSKRWNLRIQQ